MQTGNGIATQNYRDKVSSNSSDPQLTTELITPALAEEMLRHNTCNRPIRESNVAFLTNEILEGRWRLTGSSIQFVGKELVDGQHRLKAIIAAGKSVKVVVARFPATAVAKEIFKVIDVGSGRTVSDLLAIKGEVNVNILAAILTSLDRYYVAVDKAGPRAQTIPYSSQTRSAQHMIHRTASIGRCTIKKPASHILELMDKYPLARESAIFAKVTGRSKPQLLTPSQWGLLHAIYNDVDEASAAAFLGSLNTGENLSRQSPILQLRERLLSLRTDMSRNATAVGPQFVLALCNAAWNAYRTDKPINLKKVSAGDPIQIAK